MCPDTSHLELKDSESYIMANILSCEAAIDYGESPVYKDEKCASYEETKEEFENTSFFA